LKKKNQTIPAMKRRISLSAARQSAETRAAAAIREAEQLITDAREALMVSVQNLLDGRDPAALHWYNAAHFFHRAAIHSVKTGAGFML
jgi:hypothetical protein